jgi:acyl-CoA synthetase (AMP-forming)/AMP-acid ligase II
MNIGQYLVAAAKSFPDRPAISLGDQLHARYGDFLLRVARLAAGMRALPGLAPGDRIGLAMKNCPQYLEAMYAAWHAGLCAVPINAKLHPREFAYILKNSGAKICLATTELAQLLTPLVGEIDSLERVICVDDAEYDKLLSGDPLALQPAEREDPAWLFYTSGTTGKPKGAMLTHRTLAAMTYRYYADIDYLTEADCMLHGAPLSHGGGLYALPHIAKASHQIIPASHGFDPAEIIDLTHIYENLTFFAAPTMLTRFAYHPNIGAARLDSIRTIFYGGAPMYVEDLKRTLDILGPRLVQAYGQGEMPNTITYLPKRMHADRAHPRYEERLASVGIARTGVAVRIVDPDGRDVATGQIGEVAARSDVCMAGYWNNKAATGQALRDGWLFTGDLGVMSEDGFLTLKDRSKDLIISGGSNIYPREVEEVLLLHPKVLEVSVIGRKHADWGEEVIAFVVPREGETIDKSELDQVCLDNIARFKRPKDYLFIEALPKNNYGKILKTELRIRLEPAAGH